MPDIKLEYIIKKHLDDIARLEAEKYEYFGMSADAVHSKLAEEKTGGIVCTANGKVSGYMIYSLHKTEVEVNRIIARANEHQEKVFAALIGKLKSMIKDGKKTMVYMNVIEDDLETLNLFKKNGFVCKTIEYNYYEDSKRDAFRMEFGLNKPKGKDGEGELVLV
jgi:ribosomal protein S18 acetylase RimI-like enzyme